MTVTTSAGVALAMLAGLLATAPAAAAEPDVTVGIVVQTPGGEPYAFTEVSATAVDGTGGGYYYRYEDEESGLEESGPMVLAPGKYVFEIRASGPGDFTHFRATSSPRQVTGDGTVTFEPPVQPLAVSLKDHRGFSTSATGRVHCQATVDAAGDYTSVEVGDEASISNGVGTLPVVDGPDATCRARMTTPGGLDFERDYTQASAPLAIVLGAPVDLDVTLWSLQGYPEGSRVQLERAGDRPLQLGASSGGYDDEGGWEPGQTEYSFRVEASSAPVTVTTSAEQLGQLEHPMDFVVVDARRTVVLDQPRQVDLTPDLRPLTINLQDSSEQPVTGVLSVVCNDAASGAGDFTRLQYQSDEASSYDVLGLHRAGEPACALRAVADGHPVARGTADATLPAGPNMVDLTFPVAQHLIGTLSDGRAGGAITSGFVEARLGGSDDDLAYEGRSGVDGSGNFDVELAGRPVGLDAYAGSDRIDSFLVRTRTVDPTAVERYDFGPQVNPVRIDFREADGTPSTGNASLSCAGDPVGEDVRHQTLNTSRSDVDGSVTLWGMEGQGTLTTGRDEPCNLFVAMEGSFASRYLNVPVDGVDVVVYPGGKVVMSAPDAAPGADGLPDIVEAMGPNGGDGNRDGVPDHEQSHVASLPANGSSPSRDADYVTLEVPNGLTLEGVSTTAVGDLAPPPDGVDLPVGLMSFEIGGLTLGQSVTLTMTSTTSLAGVTGYAKYHDEAWSVLPATVDGQSIAVTLTDGGVGDDDGVENGRIVDPGGPAVLVNEDDDPPVVTISGVEDGGEYVLGEEPSDITCAAEDESALAGPCTVTVRGGLPNGVGEHTVTAVATDEHGNTGEEVVTYSVRYGFSGFLAPVNDPSRDPDAPMSVFKAGSTIPVKLRLMRADGTPVTPTTAPAWVAPVVTGPLSSTVNEPVTAMSATSGDVFRFVDGHWQYNLVTKKSWAGRVYEVGVELDDGTVRTVRFGLR